MCRNCEVELTLGEYPAAGRQRSASNVVVLLGLTSAIRPSLFVNPNSIRSQATSKLLPKFLNGALTHSGPNEATMET
jgi:L-asparagine transporter-like permease